MHRAIFGGSFDPIHVGHLVVARSAADQLALDVVHFVPAWQQPFKAGSHRASPEDRLAMLRLAAAEDPRFVADPREIRRAGVSYTVDTLQEMKAEFRDDRLCLLVGLDAAGDFPMWKDPDRIRQLARIVVLTRPGADAGVALPVGELLHVPEVAVSATAVRWRVERGESIDEFVPPTVAEYIESHGLYRVDSDA
jgi:nicotinate-nucleotide adenylyltransferase